VFNDFTKALKEIMRGVNYIFVHLVPHHADSDYTAIGVSNDDPDVVKEGGFTHAVKDYYNVNPIWQLIQQNRKNLIL
jgi:hypothetical protein